MPLYVPKTRGRPLRENCPHIFARLRSMLSRLPSKFADLRLEERKRRELPSPNAISKEVEELKR